MSLQHAILGILQNEPMTGYDLKTKCFDGTIAHFWPADQAQIYRTLDKLAEDGFLNYQITYQEGKPNRKVYRITPDGENELSRWLLTPQAITVYREPFLIQLFFANKLANDTLLQLLEAQANLHQARLSHYQHIPLPPLGNVKANRDLTLQRLTLELGIKLEQAHLEWIALSKEVIRNLEENE